MKKMHTILVFAQNRRGVLERITMMIRKKMYNLEQITASDTEIDGIKRITISFSHEEGVKLPQIIAQIKNIVEVVEAKVVDPDNSIQREALLVKLQRPANLASLNSLLNVFDARIVKVGVEFVVVELIDEPKRIPEFLSLISDFGVIEYGSSGGVAMEV